MKAITIKQPFATLIVDGVKDVENRSWVLPKKYIGERVLIHSSRSKEMFNKKKSLLDNDQIRHLCELGYDNKNKNTDNFPIGVILGSAVITSCVYGHESVWAMEGHYHFILAHAVRFPQPIPATGKLGFWEYDGIKAEPEEAGGALFCHCQLAVKDETQLYRDGHLVRCHYCGGIWYR